MAARALAERVNAEFAIGSNPSFARSLGLFQFHPQWKGQFRKQESLLSILTALIGGMNLFPTKNRCLQVIWNQVNGGEIDFAN